MKSVQVNILLGLYVNSNLTLNVHVISVILAVCQVAQPFVFIQSGETTNGNATTCTEVIVNRNGSTTNRPCKYPFRKRGLGPIFSMLKDRTLFGFWL